MSFMVKKSFIRENPNFEADVAAYAKEVRDWVYREKRVAKEDANPNIPPEERWSRCPAPEPANEIVASCVDKSGNVIMLIDDDDPTPEDLLQEKKSILLRDLHALEASARNSVLPVNKRPLRDMMTSDIIRADVERREEISRCSREDFHERCCEYNRLVEEAQSRDPGLLAKIGSKVGIVEDPRTAAISDIPKPEIVNPDIDAELIKMRSEEENEFLAENARIASQDQAISRAIAQALHDIEELTVDTVDGYRLPDLG